VEPLKRPSDDELLARCATGEPAAWDALLDRYAALIYSIPLRYGLPEADAADVFQSVCLTLLEKMHTIRAPRGLAAWLITTTSRQSIALARRRRREQLQGQASGLAPVIPDPDSLPEEALLALERQQIVRSAIAQLPTNCRRLIEALFSDASDQASYQQLATRLGIPMNSLGPTRARCLERLRRSLGAAGFQA
jgi:RNA polymerase sigma factor (sigma-70 family)